MATAGDGEITENDVVSPPKKSRRSIIRSLSWKRSKRNKMDENDDPQMEDPDSTKSYDHDESGLDDSCQSTKKRKRFGVWRAMKRMFRRRNNKASKSFTEGVTNSPKSHPKRSLSDPNLISSSYRPELAPLEQVENMPELNEEPSTSTTMTFAMSHDSLLSEMRSKGKVQSRKETVPIVHREPQELDWDVAPSSDALLPNLNVSRDKIKIAPRQRRAPTRKQAKKNTNKKEKSGSSGKDKKHVGKHTKEIKQVKDKSKKDIPLSEVDGEKMEVAMPRNDDFGIDEGLSVKDNDIGNVVENIVIEENEVEEEEEVKVEIDEKKNEYKTPFEELISSKKEENNKEVEGSNEEAASERSMLVEARVEADSPPEKEDETINIDPMIFNVIANTEKKDLPAVDDNKEVPERPKSASVVTDEDISIINVECNIDNTNKVIASDDTQKELASPNEEIVFPQLELSVENKPDANVSPTQSSSGGVVIVDDVKQASPVTSPSKRKSWRISSLSDSKDTSNTQVKDVDETKPEQPVGKIAVEKKPSENALQKRPVSSPELIQVTNKSSVSSEKDVEGTNEIRPKSYHEGSQVDEKAVPDDDPNIGVAKLKQAFERTNRAQTISYSERRKPEVLPKPRAASERTKSIGVDYSKSLGRNYRVPTTTTATTSTKNLNEKSLSKPQQEEKQIVTNKNSINSSEFTDKKDTKPVVKPAVFNRPKLAPKPKINMVEEQGKTQKDKETTTTSKEVLNGTTSDDTTSEVPMSSFWARRHMFSANGNEENSSPPGSPEKTKEVARHAPIINLKTDSCAVCGSKVYQMEKFKVKDNIVHRSCIKCSVCKRLLSVGNFIMSKNKIYCKPHEPSMTILNI